MDFTNKVVLVTGGSRGIGRAISQQFAERGANVIVHYHSNRAAAEETLATLAGDGHLIVQADMMKDAKAVENMVETAVSHYNHLDILINNAGIYEDHLLAETSYQDWQARWQATLDTNLIGPANAMYCAAQHMIQQGHGRIVNVSSRGAFRGEPTAPAYGASKAGMNAMSQSLAKYLAPYNIFVGVVAPGFVETEMAKEHLKGRQGDEIRAQSPLNRVATAAEVAYGVIFLASAGSEFMTGTILDVNGASYLRS